MKKKSSFLILIISFLLFAFSLPCFAGEDGFTQKDRELMVRLDERLNQMDKRFELMQQQIANLREDMNHRFKQVEKRFELMQREMDKRFDQVDQRFKQVEKRFELMQREMDKRFEQVDQRFEQVDQRFDQVDRRLEEMNKWFERIIYLMMSIVAAFAAIVAVAIGFAVWDRRTMVRPFEDRVKKIESDIANDREKLHSLIAAFRKLAKHDSKVAEILRSFSLL